MTDREKLVELIQEGECKCVALEDCSYCKYDGEDDCSCQLLVEFLLVNGVKVQWWIPVTERLPEVGRRVLVTDGKHVSFGYNLLGGEENLWYVQFPCNDDEVTHWMPLPEPPMRKEKNDGTAL